ITFSETSTQNADGVAGTCDDFQYTITRTWTPKDACGNYGTPCVQVISVDDTTPPVIDAGSCPGDLSLECSAMIPPPAAVTATDNCDPNPTITFSETSTQGDDPEACSFYNYTITRVWTPVDACGNEGEPCFQVITIEDTTPPEMTCSTSEVVECGNPTAPPAVAPPIATDNCSGVTLTYSDDFVPGECGGTGVITRTWTGTDACGNSTTCVQTITLVDTTPPFAVECPNDLTLGCEEVNCLDFNQFAHGTVLTQVVEGGVTIDIEAWSKGGMLEDAVVFHTEDPALLGEDEDLGSPNVLYGGPGVNSNDPNGYAPSNNRAVGNILVVQQTGSPFPNDHLLSDSIVYHFSEPVFVKSLIALDYEGSQAATGAGVFLYGSGGLLQFHPFDPLLGNDNSLEEITLIQPGVTKLVVYYGFAVPSSGGVAQICFSDIPDEDLIVEDCSGVESIANSVSAQQIDDCTTVLTQTFEATDFCGNTNTQVCVREITVVSDALAPEIDCPADVTIGCNDPLPPVDISQVSATDNCTETNSIFITYVGDIVEGTGCDQEVRRIYSATDTCGNTGLCVQFIRREATITVNAQVYLQAAMNQTNTGMDANLNAILPLNQPYNVAPFNHAGTESVAGFGPNVVDWMLLELRDAVTDDLVAARAALLLTDGSIVDLDESSDVTFIAPPDFYTLVVRHRNHLDIKSSAPVDLSSGSGGCNFMTGCASSVGMYELSAGMYAMYMGDVNGDQQVSYNGGNNDKNEVLAAVGLLTPNNILSGYYFEDVNMDGQVRYNNANNDKNAILSVVGLLTPNNIVFGQLN
ncbi:MAG: HYR domain-containing protein, partial [Saprospiraceae bacterium]|nr:HYR domain-containing protein [Saprospiraceae bacterium]